MGQVLHDSATTTEALSRAIKNSEASLRAPSARHWFERDGERGAVLGFDQVRERHGIFDAGNRVP